MKRYVGTLCVLCAALILSVGFKAVSTAEPLYGRPITGPETSDSNTAESETSDENTTTKRASSGKTEGTAHGNSAETTTTADVQQHLTAGKLKFCENHAATITTIMERSSTRAQNQITLFSDIATKVENFYTSKGKTMATYDQLVATINAAESKANTDFAALQGSDSFSCSSNNPGGAVSTYRANLKTVQVDLQDLQHSIRSLIVAVAQAEGYTLPKASTGGGQ